MCGFLGLLAHDLLLTPVHYVLLKPPPRSFDPPSARLRIQVERCRYFFGGVFLKKHCHHALVVQTQTLVGVGYGVRRFQVYQRFPLTLIWNVMDDPVIRFKWTVQPVTCLYVADEVTRRMVSNPAQPRGDALR